MSKGEDCVQWNQLITAFPALKDHVEPPQGERAIMTSVHCELTLAAHLFQKYKDDKARKTFDIGISKRTCWLCQRYLNFLGQSCGMRFVVSKYHGKIYPGWKPPPDGSPKAFKRIVRLLEQEIDEILETVWQRRYSDSFPGSLVNLGDLSGLETKGRSILKYVYDLAS